MLQSNLSKRVEEEISFYQNYLYRFLWQTLFWSFWTFWLVATVIFLLGERTFWLGLLSAIILIPQVKSLFRSKGLIPLGEESDQEAWNYLKPKTKKAILAAYLLSRNTGQPISVSLLKTLKNNREVEEIFRKVGLNKKKDLEREISSIQEEGSEEKEEKIKAISEIIKEALLEADFLDSKAIEPYHLILALAKTRDQTFLNVLLHLGINEKDLESSAQIMSFQKNIKRGILKRLPYSLGRMAPKHRVIKHRIMNRAWTARPTPLLDRLSQDLTDLARYNLIGFMADHKEEYKRLLSVLSRDFRNNALLVGREGVGKETLVNHIAWRIVNDQVPKKLFDKRVVKLNLADLPSGAQTEGELKEKAETILGEIIKAKNVILYIPDIEQLFSRGETALLAEIFIPYFRESSFQAIASTSEKGLEELRKHQELLSTFEDIEVKEISEIETLKVLVLYSLILEKKHKIEISLPSLRKVVELAKVYDPRKVFPQAAVELLDESVKEASERKLNLLTEETITEITEEKTGIPLKKVSEIEAEKLLKIEETIHRDFINQEEAVKVVSNALRNYRAGLRPEKGPIAGFLFVGPTGVGKTQLSKTLAKIIFGSQEQIVRFDMSKYRTSLGIWKFIGSPNGESGDLSSAILKKPYSLILLDEFEKATTEILNLFLPILDEGKITDNLGQKLDFSNSLIIATSNAHSEYIFEQLEKGLSYKEINENLKTLLVKDFPPELLNRFTDIIIFKPLSKENIEKIAILKLKPLEEELSQRYRYNLKISEKALSALVKEGYSKEFGARPLEHTIEKEIKSLLSEEILKNQWPAETKIEIDWNEKGFYVNIN